MKRFFLLAVYWSMYSHCEILCVEPVVNMRICKFIEKTNCPLSEFTGRVTASHPWTSTMRPRRKREGLWEWRSISLGQEAGYSWHAHKEGHHSCPFSSKEQRAVSYTDFQRTQGKFWSRGPILWPGIQEGTNKDRPYNSGSSWMSSWSWEDEGAWTLKELQCHDVCCLSTLEKVTMGCGLISRESVT